MVLGLAETNQARFSLRATTHFFGQECCLDCPPEALYHPRKLIRTKNKESPAASSRRVRRGASSLDAPRIAKRERVRVKDITPTRRLDKANACENELKSSHVAVQTIRRQTKKPWRSYGAGLGVLYCAPLRWHCVITGSDTRPRRCPLWHESRRDSSASYVSYTPYPYLFLAKTSPAP